MDRRTRPTGRPSVSGRAALRAKLTELGIDLADNQLNDVFVRFKDLADRKKEVYDDDIIAIVDQSAIAGEQKFEFVSLKVICGSEGQTADLVMAVDGEEKSASCAGNGPVDAVFNCIKEII